MIIVPNYLLLLWYSNANNVCSYNILCDCFSGMSFHDSFVNSNI